MSTDLLPVRDRHQVPPRPQVPGSASGGARTPSGPSRQRGGGRQGGRRTPWALFLFPLPALLLYSVFFAVPTLQAVQYAVTDWDGFSPDYANVGLGNFRQIATDDLLFASALVNNLKFLLVVVVLQTLISLVLALLLVRNSRSSILLRSIYFFPTILSSVSVAFVWKFLYDPNFGLLNTVLGAVGLESLQSAYLGDDRRAIYWVALTQVWAHAGQMMVIYIAGLQQVPQELTEAALLDGAGRWARFRYLTWPLIAPATGIVMAYTTIQSFRAFDLILGLGGNPPKPSLDILSTRIYSSFANSEFGYAAAESLFFMGIIATVTLVQRRAVRLTQRA